MKRFSVIPCQIVRIMKGSNASLIFRWAPMVDLSHSSLQNHLLSLALFSVPGDWPAWTASRKHLNPLAYSQLRVGGSKLGGDWKDIRIFMFSAPSLPYDYPYVPWPKAIVPIRGAPSKQLPSLDSNNYSLPLFLQAYRWWWWWLLLAPDYCTVLFEFP